MFDSLKSTTITCSNQGELENLLYAHYKACRQDGFHSSTLNSYEVRAVLARAPFTAYPAIIRYEVEMSVADFKAIQDTCHKEDALNQILTGENDMIEQGHAQLKALQEAMENA